MVRLIYVNARSWLILQYYKKWSEFGMVASGSAIVELDGRAVILT